MKGIEIIKHKAKSEDERGAVFAYVANQKIKETLIVIRKKGSIAGNHYHSGTDTSRNPEIQYVIAGELKLTVKNIDTKEQEMHIIPSNTEIKLFPKIAHKLEMLTDVVFLEFHVEESDDKDVVKVDL
jgi:hypothetical protein